MSPTTVVVVVAVAAVVGPRLVALVRRRSVLRRLAPRSGTRLIHAPSRAVDAMRAADIGVDPDEAVTLWLAGAVLAAATVPVFGAAGFVILGTMCAGPPLFLSLHRDRRAQRRRQELPVLADAAASAVRGGASLPAALGAASATLAGPLASDLVAITQQVDQGIPVVAAFEAWSHDPDSDFRLAGRAISMVAEHGGRAGAALERTATVLRSREDLRRERVGMATQARASAAVMTVAPLGFVMVSGVADPRTLHFLLATPSGAACLVAGLALDLIGARWMSAIARHAA